MSANRQDCAPTDPSAIRVKMAYSVPVDGDAVIRIFPPNSGKSMETPARVRHDMMVTDCRPIADELSMDTAGFAFQKAPTSFTNFFDTQAVKTRYYDECANLLKQTLDAEAVFVFDHNVRSRERSDAGQEGVRRPADGAHNDYTLTSGPRRIREVLEENDAASLLDRRAALINLWRPLRGPVQDHPLGICDARSTSPDDFMATRIEHFVEGELEAPNLSGEVYLFLHNPAHRWYYVSDMRADEALFLKCFDTAEDGRARFTGHSSFCNPASPEHALPRESIEVRTVVVYREPKA
jgi:hypothetical protein